ncbi:MAG: DUF4249 domain-containing protein [Paludibacter sp.]|nr:DUF4249 domain-containing protein [Paludibacter sp.]
MRKNRTLLMILILSTGLLISCKKVIQLDLSSEVPQLVIQGNIYDEPGPYVVNISRTVNFDTPNVFPAVTNAVVTISDNAGVTEDLSQATDGNYVTSAMKGVVGHTYTLTVKVDGKTYTASSKMPPPVDIDTIYFKKSLFGGGRLITLDFRNQGGKENFYQIIHLLNGKQIPGFSVFSNNTVQTEKISYSFMTTNSSPQLVAGDKIDVWLECIDKGVFDYFRTANMDRGRSASPANPVTNITNGSLGFFNACSVRKKQFIYH